MPSAYAGLIDLLSQYVAKLDATLYFYYSRLDHDE